MKKQIKFKILFGITLLISAALFTIECGYTVVQNLQNSDGEQSSNNNDAVSDTSSYYDDTANYDQTLTEYGDWIMISPYGNVWKPFVANTWQPYYYGHWVYSDYGWTWVSYEPFGWIVYHYGYWLDNQYYGWVWIPADDPWSQARVDWNNYGNYICWAPLPPPGISYSSPWESQKPVWHSVQYNNFTQNDLNNYYVDPSVLRNDMGGRSSVSHTPPNINNIRTRVPGNVPTVKMSKENVRKGSGQIIRMRVPSDQQKIIRSHAPEIQRTVIQKHDIPTKQKENQNNPQKQKKQGNIPNDQQRQEKQINVPNPQQNIIGDHATQIQKTVIQKPKTTTKPRKKHKTTKKQKKQTIQKKIPSNQQKIIQNHAPVNQRTVIQHSNQPNNQKVPQKTQQKAPGNQQKNIQNHAPVIQKTVIQHSNKPNNQKEPQKTQQEQNKQKNNNPREKK
jgi:Family of unknown function (DUF6600)